MQAYRDYYRRAVANGVKAEELSAYYIDELAAYYEQERDTSEE